MFLSYPAANGETSTDDQFIRGALKALQARYYHRLCVFIVEEKGSDYQHDGQVRISRSVKYARAERY